MPTLKPDAIKMINRFIDECEEIIASRRTLQSEAFDKYDGFEARYAKYNVNFEEFSRYILRPLQAYVKTIETFDDFERALEIMQSKDPKAAATIARYGINSRKKFDELKEAYDVEVIRPTAQRQISAAIYIAKQLRDHLDQYNGRSEKDRQLRKFFSIIDGDNGTWLPVLSSESNEAIIKFSELLETLLLNFDLSKYVEFSIFEKAILSAFNPQKIIRDMAEGIKANINFFEFQKSSLMASAKSSEISQNMGQKLGRELRALDPKDNAYLIKYNEIINDYLSSVDSDLYALPFMGLATNVDMSRLSNEKLKALRLSRNGGSSGILSTLLGFDLDQMGRLFFLTDEFLTPIFDHYQDSWNRGSYEHIIIELEQLYAKFIRSADGYKGDGNKKKMLSSLKESIEGIMEKVVTPEAIENIYNEFYFYLSEKDEAVDKLSAEDRKRFEQYIDYLPNIFSIQKKDELKLLGTENLRKVCQEINRHIHSLQEDIFAIFKEIQSKINEHNDYCSQKGKLPGETGKILDAFRHEVTTLLKKINYSNDPGTLKLILVEKGRIESLRSVLPAIKETIETMVKPAIELMISTLNSLSGSEVTEEDLTEKKKIFQGIENKLYKYGQEISIHGFGYPLPGQFVIFYNQLKPPTFEEMPIGDLDDIKKFFFAKIDAKIMQLRNNKLEAIQARISQQISEYEAQFNKDYSELVPILSAVESIEPMQDIGDFSDANQRSLTTLIDYLTKIDSFIESANLHIQESEDLINSEELAKLYNLVERHDTRPELQKILDESLRPRLTQVLAMKPALLEKIRIFREKADNLRAQKIYEDNLKENSPKGLLRARNDLQILLDSSQRLVMATKQKMDNTAKQMNILSVQKKELKESLMTFKNERSNLDKSIKTTDKKLPSYEVRIQKLKEENHYEKINNIEQELIRLKKLAVDNPNFNLDLKRLKRGVEKLDLKLESDDFRIQYDQDNKKDKNLFNNILNILERDIPEAQREAFRKSCQAYKKLQVEYLASRMWQFASRLRSSLLNDATPSQLMQHKRTLTSQIATRIENIARMKYEIASIPDLEKQLAQLKEQEQELIYLERRVQTHSSNISRFNELDGIILRDEKRLGELEQEEISLQFEMAKLSPVLASTKASLIQQQEVMGSVSSKLETVLGKYHKERLKFKQNYKKLQDVYNYYKKRLASIKSAVRLGEERLRSSISVKPKDAKDALHRLIRLKNERNMFVAKFPVQHRQDLLKDLEQHILDLNIDDMRQKFNELYDQSPLDDVDDYEEMRVFFHHAEDLTKELQQAKENINDQLSSIDNLMQVDKEQITAYCQIKKKELEERIISVEVESRNILVELAHDEDNEVKMIAAHRLGNINNPSAEVIKILTKLARHEDEKVSTAATQSLARIKNPSDEVSSLMPQENDQMKSFSEKIVSLTNFVDNINPLHQGVRFDLKKTAREVEGLKNQFLSLTNSTNEIQKLHKSALRGLGKESPVTERLSSTLKMFQQLSAKVDYLHKRLDERLIINTARLEYFILKEKYTSILNEKYETLRQKIERRTIFDSFFNTNAQDSRQLLLLTKLINEIKLFNATRDPKRIETFIIQHIGKGKINYDKNKNIIFDNKISSAALDVSDDLSMIMLKLLYDIKQIQKDIEPVTESRKNKIT